MQLRHRVQDADEASEQAVVVEIAGEHVDAPAMQRDVFLPIAPCHVVEPFGKESVVGRAVGLVVGLPEEAEERVVRGKVDERRKLEPRQGDMVGVEIDGDNLRRICGQVVENVAAAGGNGDQPVVRLEIEGSQIDIGVFPDLVVHKSLKHQGEQTLQNAAPCIGGPLVSGALEKQVGHGFLRKTRVVA